MIQTLAERITAVQTRIVAAAHRSGRDPDSITLVAVTKTQAPEIVRAAIAAGVSNLGENRVQEAGPKIAALSDLRSSVSWHLIGHLQRNKARQASELFDIVHSVDSLRLAEALDRQVSDRRLPVLLQVNVSGEQSKEGFDLAGGLENNVALDTFMVDVESILALPRIEVRGLMTIAPFSMDPEQARPGFRALRLLRDELARRFTMAAWDELSMGMTDDFEVAIEEGATIVRVGRALFGER